MKDMAIIPAVAVTRRDSERQLNWHVQSACNTDEIAENWGRDSMVQVSMKIGNCKCIIEDR